MSGENLADLQQVLDWKEKGNAAFSSGDMEQAVHGYSEAIGRAVEILQMKREGGPAAFAPDLVPGAASIHGITELVEILPTLFNNRSTALHKLSKFKESLHDAEQAIAMKPMFVKAFHRKAQALISMGYLDQARDTYSIALDGEPENKFLKKQVEELDAKTGRQSAHAKIEKFIQQNGTIKGCPTKLSLSMFEVEEVLGEGNYSVVTRVRFKKTGELFAIKTVDKSKVDRMSKRHPNIHNELRMEKKLLLRMNHPNIIKLHHTMQDVSSLYYVQELAPGGELWARLRFGKESLASLRPSLARFYCAQLVNALDYMRLNGVVHRDIKPENMMLFPMPGTNNRIEFVKVIDFGTAYDMVETDLNGPKFVGTPEYMSPEAIAAKADPTYALDVWATGCTLFQLNSGRLPFKGSSPYLTFLKTQALDYEMPNYFSDDLADLLQKMFKEEPSERLGANDGYVSLKTHPYFEETDFLELQTRPCVPIPTLFELCLDAAMKTFFVEKENNQMKVHPALDGKSSLQNKLPEWATKTGTFAPGKVAPLVRNTLMGYLAQRLALGRPGLFRLFFESASVARFKRASSKSFIGLSEQEQGKFKDPYLAVHLPSLAGHTPQIIEDAMRRLNRLEPKPKVLILGGDIGDFESNSEALLKLDDRIPIVCAYDGRESHQDLFGDSYYSFYVCGVIYISINSFLLAEMESESPSEAALAHSKWFKHQITHGKLCARHIIVISYHAWYLPSEGDQFGDGHYLPEKVAREYLEELRQAGAQIVLATGASKAFAQPHKPAADLHTKVVFTNTCSGSTALTLRIVRVQDSCIVSDEYKVDELPSWFSLENTLVEEEQEQEEEQGFSDISSSDDEEGS